MTPDPSLERFVAAQRRDYAQALAELRAGRKRSHWVWYVLPQLRGLGASAMATAYGLASADEARAYLAHPVLGARLRECVEALATHRGQPIARLLGDVDAVKYRSCLTLFEHVDAQRPSVFAQALADFHGGARDPLTRRLLAAAGDAPAGG